MTHARRRHQRSLRRILRAVARSRRPIIAVTITEQSSPDHTTTHTFRLTPDGPYDEGGRS